VTQIERLVRDPYAIYAEKVLRLRPLDPLGQPPDYLERGIVVHAIAQRFVDATRAGLPDRAAATALLLEVAEGVLAERVPWPDMRRIWRARIARAAGWLVDTEAARRAAGAPLALEVKGAIELDAPAGPFRLTARADRVDRLLDGGAAIYDYKAGDPPTKAQIDQGFNQQLHLQAAILSAGGFASIGALEPRLGAYLAPHGKGAGGSERRVETLAEEIADHMEKLRRLIARYDHPETPYLSWARPERESDTGDYDHLARRGEWEGGGA
ncbi:MAG TPA: PD-(D/E)XK nuclease family protein, partial [Thermohalobaculum sp.]|nr:PD-(D/E)XK nuclease family protein [Thermohalobaculum sp.]